MLNFVELLLFIALFGLPTCLSVKNSCPKELRDKIDDRYLQEFHDYCFYFETLDYKTYPEANVTCRQLGGTLAIPKTKDINTFLADEVSHLQYDYPLWIGMHDTEEEGTYVWEDGSPVTWTNFAFGTGGYFNGETENCIALEPMSQLWHDYRCNSSSWTSSPNKAYICQYPYSLKGRRVGADDKNTHDDDDEKVDDDEQDLMSDRSTIKSDDGRIDEETEESLNDSTTAGEKQKDNDKADSNDNCLNPKGDEIIRKHGYHCPPFFCGKDCGMAGFILAEDMCPLCKCNQ